MSAFLLAAALGAAQPGPAQSAASPGDEAIVVTGQKDDRKAVSDFVRALTPTKSGQQLSRFEHSVCPAVFGLGERQSTTVANRIRLIAKSVGIVVGGQHCAANVVLIVASDKKAVLEELRRHHSDYFGGMGDGTIRALESQPGRAASWQLQGPPMTQDGKELINDTTTGLMVNRSISPSSRITEPVHPQFDAAVVVVERSALPAITVTQLADYVAMRALTGADPARLANSGAPTILHVLDAAIGAETPITMTQWDLSFLRGYYDARRNLRPSAQRSAITDTMAKDLKPKH